jgi:hypothetical protein
MLARADMFSGCETILRWLESVGASDASPAQTPTALVVRGRGPQGDLLVSVFGLTPNSLYSSGDFVPLTARLELGTRPAALDAFGARTDEGMLWMTATGDGYRSVALSGLDPLSPFNRLTLGQIERFLEWARALFAPEACLDAGLALRFAADACREALDSVDRRAYVRLPWRAAPDRELRAKLATAMRSVGLFDSVEEQAGGRSGSVIVSGRLVARARARGVDLLRVEVDIYRLLLPSPSAALDDLLVDVDALRDSIALMPPRFIMLRAGPAPELGLEGIAGLHRIATDGAFAGWSGLDAEGQRLFEGLLADLAHRVRSRLAGPYR